MTGDDDCDVQNADGWDCDTGIGKGIFGYYQRCIFERFHSYIGPLYRSADGACSLTPSITSIFELDIPPFTTCPAVIGLSLSDLAKSWCPRYRELRTSGNTALLRHIMITSHHAINVLTQYCFYRHRKTFFVKAAYLPLKLITFCTIHGTGTSTVQRTTIAGLHVSRFLDLATRLHDCSKSFVGGIRSRIPYTAQQLRGATVGITWLSECAESIAVRVLTVMDRVAACGGLVRVAALQGKWAVR